MATQTESAWCETRVENWLREHYDDVQRFQNQFPDFRVGQDLAVEVTALKTLAVAGTSSAETVERRVQCIIEGSLAGIPFHPSYGRCHLVVEYGLPKPPRKHALLQQVRTALEPYAEPGQLICADPCLRLECGVRLGLLSVTSVPHFQDHASDNWEPEGAGSDGVVNRSWSGRRSNMLSWSTCSIW